MWGSARAVATHPGRDCPESATGKQAQLEQVGVLVAWLEHPGYVKSTNLGHHNILLSSVKALTASASRGRRIHIALFACAHRVLCSICVTMVTKEYDGLWMVERACQGVNAWRLIILLVFESVCQGVNAWRSIILQGFEACSEVQP
eukprot:1156388-Pelagomonas_calceolata.AAC.2